MEAKQWQNLSTVNQLGNIGSEISRAQHWRQKNDLNNSEAALTRALDLVNLTLSDKKNFGRAHELARLKEVVADLLAKTNIYNVSFSDLSSVLMNFAILARKPR